VKPPQVEKELAAAVAAVIDVGLEFFFQSIKSLTLPKPYEFILAADETCSCSNEHLYVGDAFAAYSSN
jgi:hypothetical protein